MRIIASSLTTLEAKSANLSVLPRRKRVSVNDVIKNESINVYWYDNTFQYCKKYWNRYINYCVPISYSDILWQRGCLLLTKKFKHPDWFGLVQHIKYDNCSWEKSQIYLITLIDLNPSYNICIHSTFSYVEEPTLGLSIALNYIIFDQRHWLQAVSVLKSKRYESSL